MAVDDYLQRALRLLERAIRQRWADGQIAKDANGDTTALGPSEIEQLMHLPGPSLGAVQDFDYSRDTPLGKVVGNLQLMPTEADLLAVLLACETEPAAARLVAYLNGTTTAVVTVDILFEIGYRPRALQVGHAATLIHTDLASDAMLRRLKMIVLDGVESRPFLQQAIRLTPRMTGWLLARASLDPELAAFATLRPAAPPKGPCEPAALALAERSFEDRDRLLAVHGAPGSGRALLLQALSHAIGKPLLLVRGRGLPPERIINAFREATLQDAVLAFRDTADILASEDARATMRECLEVYRNSVAMLGLEEHGSVFAHTRPTIDIAIPIPEDGERLGLWKTHLHDAQLTDQEWQWIASLYRLGIGGVLDVAGIARSLAATDGSPITRGHIARAIRQLFETDLETVANRVEVKQEWTDVVLPDEVFESVRGIVDRVVYRNEVFGNWGFGRKVGKGLGLTVLFSGQPGTGKSMVAGLIARELGLDLYVINLSRVMSKWLGETEKNLERAFDAAEAGHVMLLFDEADTILGKRTTDIKSSNDRHANLETNFILARLERFTGIAVFTTNIASAIDPAIIRRMSANITFPFPDAEARTELWRRMLPSEAPISDQIDFGDLASRYELSGGFIRNVVLRAAFIAAREKSSIGMPHLERAAKGEYSDRGALTSGGRLA